MVEHFLFSCGERAALTSAFCFLTPVFISPSSTVLHPENFESCAGCSRGVRWAGDVEMEDQEEQRQTVKGLEGTVCACEKEGGCQMDRQVDGVLLAEFWRTKSSFMGRDQVFIYVNIRCEER